MPLITHADRTNMMFFTYVIIVPFTDSSITKIDKRIFIMIPR